MKKKCPSKDQGSDVERFNDYDSNDSIFENRLEAESENEGEVTDAEADESEIPTPAQEPDVAADSLVAPPPRPPPEPEHVADSVVSPPPPPPAPEAQSAPPPPPWVTCSFPRGRVTWYRSKTAFQATCAGRNHVRCILTRTSNNNGPMQGRPMALIAAWLSWPEDLTREQHMALVPELEKFERLEARMQWRRQLLDGPQFAAMLQRERSLRPGEGPEPPGTRE